MGPYGQIHKPQTIPDTTLTALPMIAKPLIPMCKCARSSESTYSSTYSAYARSTYARSAYCR